MIPTSVRNLLQALTPFDMVVWGIVFLLILAGMGLAVRAEKRRYQALGKRDSWLCLRLSSLPILVVSGLSVLIPARAVSGPEALAAFYIALFTVCPIVWFGLHWIIGSILSPRLTRAESAGVALTGLALLILPVLAVNMLHGPLFTASHQWKERAFARAGHAPLAHQVLPMQCFQLGGEPDDLFAQTLRAPAGVRLERVDVLLGAGWHDTKSLITSYFCRDNDDLHLAWSAGFLPLPLRLYWRDGRGELSRAEFHVNPVGAEQLPVKPFVIGWRDDGIDLPVPIARHSIQLGWPATDGKLYYRELNPLQPGETFGSNCIMSGYRRLAWKDEGPVAGLMLRFYPYLSGTPKQYEFRRPK